MKKTTSTLALSAFISIITSLTVNAQNPQLWGLTTAGGTDTIGTIFKIRGDGSSFQMVQSLNAVTGNTPSGTLMLANDNKLYGLTQTGGANNKGTIFSLDATGTFTSLHSFTGIAGNAPFGKLLQADNGNLYGMTFYDDSIGAGVVFKYNPINNTFAKLKTFDGTGNGQSPRGSLMQASNGKMYGLTPAGGASQHGTLVSFDTTTNIITNLHSFATPTGYNPFGDLIQASNGLMYGLTMYVGTVNATPGSLFSFNPATNVYTDLIHFNSANGGFPMGSLIQASDGKLYGLTSGGGPTFKGVMFSYTIATNTLTDLVTFTGTNGSTPKGSLMQASDGNLYGMTSIGGANNKGVIFKYSLPTNSYLVIHDFNGTEGSRPFGSLVEAFAPSTTGIENESSEANLSISPNPSNGLVTLTYSALPSIIEVTDELGKTVYSAKPNNLKTTLNLQNKAKGIYFVKSTDSKKVTTRKIIIE